MPKYIAEEVRAHDRSMSNPNESLPTSVTVVIWIEHALDLWGIPLTSCAVTLDCITRRTIAHISL